MTSWHDNSKSGDPIIAQTRLHYEDARVGSEMLREEMLRQFRKEAWRYKIEPAQAGCWLLNRTVSA